MKKSRHASWTMAQALDFARKNNNAELLEQLTSPANNPRHSPTLPQACVSGPKSPDTAKPPGKRRKAMNQTESEFALFLENEVRHGLIKSFAYESTTLRWGTLDPIAYTPDFTVIVEVSPKGTSRDPIAYPLTRTQYIECKGAHIWAKDMARFKQARNEFPLFEFCMWQRTKAEGWKRIL